MDTESKLLKNKTIYSEQEELDLLKNAVYDLGYTLHIVDPADMTFPIRMEIMNGDKVVAKLEPIQPDWYYEAIKTYKDREPGALLTTAAKCGYPQKLTVY